MFTEVAPYPIPKNISAVVSDSCSMFACTLCKYPSGTVQPLQLPVAVYCGHAWCASSWTVRKAGAVAKQERLVAWFQATMLYMCTFWFEEMAWRWPSLLGVQNRSLTFFRVGVVIHWSSCALPLLWRCIICWIWLWIKNIKKRKKRKGHSKVKRLQNLEWNIWRNPGL